MSDFPDTTFHPALGNHFLSNQRGFFIKGMHSEIRGKFRINQQGWNSPHDYTANTPLKTYRIAVIGDSYIEALQVDYDKSYPYLLEKYINAEETMLQDVEVYSFGHSGAQLAQYLNVLRHVTQKYQPDLVVFNIVYNDFIESLHDHSRKDNLSLEYSGESFSEIMPRPMNTLGLKKFLRKSALARYLILNMDIANRIRPFTHFFYADIPQYNANVNSTYLDKDLSFLKNMIEYVFIQSLNALKPIDARLLLILDANRASIYENASLNDSKIHLFQEATKATAENLNIPLLELDPVFRETWKLEKKKFEFKFDGHWNGYAHRIISETLKSRIILHLGNTNKKSK